MSLISEQEALYQLLENKDYSDETFILATKSKKNIDTLRTILEEKDDEIRALRSDKELLIDNVRDALENLSDLFNEE